MANIIKIDFDIEEIVENVKSELEWDYSLNDLSNYDLSDMEDRITALEENNFDTTAADRIAELQSQVNELRGLLKGLGEMFKAHEWIFKPLDNGVVDINDELGL